MYNGDLGFIRSIDVEAGEVMVEVEGHEVTYGYGKLDELVLAPRRSTRRKGPSARPR